MEINNINQVLNTQLSDSPKVSTKVVTSQAQFNPFASNDNSILAKDSSIPFEGNSLNPVEGYTAARNELLKYFKQDFSKTDQFKQVFGNASVDDVQAALIARINLVRDRKTEAQEFQGKAYYFTAEMSGVSGEVAIDKKSGAVRRISIQP